MNTQQLLDRVFKDPRTKHYLDLFTLHEKNRLQMFERKDRVRIRCMVRDRDYVARPEEVVRQLALIHLHYTLAYPIDRLAVEVPVQMGSGVHEKAADVVAYRDPQKLIPYIIVEVKKPRRKDGREQLHSYMNATGAPYGWWTNGRETSYEIRTEPNLFGDLLRLPNVNETEEDVRQPIRKHQLKPAEDLVTLVLRMQEEVLANAGVNVFEEVFKLFFVKQWDEESASDDPASPRAVCRFRVTAAPPEEQMARFQRLLDEAIDAHPGIFPEGTKFDLSPEALAVVVSVLEKVRLSDTDMELMDHAFEYLLAPESKGDKGQYFTPRQVVRMAVKMLNPRPHERVLDPACGPCGFLIHTLLHVRDNYLRREYPRNWEVQVQKYGSRRLYAVDFDPRVERVARFMMWVAGDGSANVFRMNSLDPREWKRDPRFMREVAGGGSDIIMTNPPFAGTIRHPEILTRYDLAYQEKLVRRQTKETVDVHRERKRQNTVTRDVLFLERCLQWLKPGGRMAIVLPQGNFNNINAESIRREIIRRARILAVIGLHGNTFKPHTGTKTSVLFLQKWDEEQASEWEAWYQAIHDHEAAVDAYQRRVTMRDELAQRKKPIPAELSDLRLPGDPPAPPWDYPIFFATSKRSGRDNSGEPAYRKGPDGEILTEPKEVLVHDEEGALVLATRQRKVLDCDLDEIADAFIAWGREQGLDFFSRSPSGLLLWREAADGANIDVSEVRVSSLERTKRIDAEYYHPRYLELEARLAGCQTSYLPEVCYVTDGNHFKVSDYFMPEGEYRYLRGQDLTDFFVGEANPVYIPEEIFSSLESSHMKPLDVLLSIVGTIGAVGIIPPDWPVATGSCKLAILRAQEIDPYYLAVFWASKYGRFQAERNTRGSVQMGLVLDDFPHLKVVDAPSAFQEEIAGLVRAAYEQRQESKCLYRQAEKLLLDELGLQNLELPEELHSQAILTQAWEAHRIDAEYFRPRCLAATKAINNCGHPVYSLQELLTAPLTNGATPPGADYTEGNVVFLTAENVRELQVWPDDKRITAEFSNDVLARSCLEPGDLLITIKGKVSIAAVVPEFEGEWNINQDVARARINPSLNPYYLAVFFESELGQVQADRMTTGAINPFLGLGNLLNFPIPIPPRDVQDKFEQITQTIIENHRKFRTFLEQAKHKVEALIESKAVHG